MLKEQSTQGNSEYCLPSSSQLGIAECGRITLWPYALVGGHAGYDKSEADEKHCIFSPDEESDGGGG